MLHARQAKELGDGFGVFLIDWRLPDINGIETARRIRQAIGDESPIVLVTAHDWPSIKDEALAAGVNAFCNKPLFLSELHATLLNVIEERQPEDVNMPAQEVADFSGRRVLLVEDIKINREIAMLMLGAYNLQIEQAVNGQEAVEMVKSNEPDHYDAIFMDIQMPVMNGYEAAQAIRQLDGARSQVPIIAMTANAFDEDRQRALESGMNAHVAKPIDTNQLESTLREILAG